MTPRETFAAIEAANWRAERTHRRDAWLAWHTAALTRARRLPSLQRLIKPRDAKPLVGDELERRRSERDEILKSIDVDKINEVMRNRGR
jgi:hypothetical protein